MARRPTLEDEQQALAVVAADPRSDDARQRLRRGLGSKRSLLAARAARLIREHHLDGFEADLVDTFTRFLSDPVKSDPSCSAKLAAIEALDYGESSDVEPFVRAARHVQLEPAWGPPVDTAAPLRARGILALARIGPDDFQLLAAELLTDKESPVRQAAADALGHRGDRAGAALALLKLRIGDEDSLVTLAAMSALMALAPDVALVEVGRFLDGDDLLLRELAAVALGQSRRDDALELLLAALERCVRADERAPLVRGIGLHRSERALLALLTVIAERAPADAQAAIAALAARRFEPGLAARVRAAAERNARAELDAALAAAFPP
jgi:hypothetical protein